MSPPLIKIVPIVTAIPKSERISNLNHVFYEEFGENPMFITKVPGRVNIIGEHIDYCGYPVLPMALEQDILIATRTVKRPELQIRNVNNRYEKFDLIINQYQDIEIKPNNDGKPFWFNYVLCGVKGALEYLENNMYYGLQICVDGNIPPASGLSSSSALVSAACLSFLYAQNVTLSKTDIASLCAKSERYIGTQGGGMDQAIAFLAEKYSAQYITFNPLNATSVALPENAAFVVAHSMAEANKAATNDFNRRVIECRLAAKILEKSEGMNFDGKIITLSELQRKLSKSLEQMKHLVLEKLAKDIYTKSEVSMILDIDENQMEEIFLTENTKHLSEFKLKQRALHVYEEAIRVEEFRKLCDVSLHNDKKQNGSNGSNSDTTNVLNKLGKLMHESHESLKNLYECSHKNLDLLVDISMKMNVNARLTGAGWGGCIVALCPKDKVGEYVSGLKREFYGKYCNIEKNKIDSYVFATTPNHGAVIYIGTNDNNVV